MRQVTLRTGFVLIFFLCGIVVLGAVNAACSALQWGSGIAVTPDSYSVPHYQLTGDGAGGGFVSWAVMPSNDAQYVDRVFVQHVTISGSLGFGSGGVILSTAGYGSGGGVTNCIGDGSGGVITAWIADDDASIYAQKVNSSGLTQWASGGVKITNSVTQGFSVPFAMVSDGSGGAIIVWENGAGDAYAQKINAAGVVQWAPNGAVVCSGPDNQSEIRAVSDGAGGAVMVWINQNDLTLYAQKIDTNGSLKWGLANSSGAPVQTSTLSSSAHEIAADGSGGVIVAYAPDLSGDRDIEVIALKAADGSRNWNITYSKPNAQDYPVLSGDDAGGAVISWIDSADLKSHIQKLSKDSYVQWGAAAGNSKSFSALAGTQMTPRLASLGSGRTAVVFLLGNGAVTQGKYTQVLDADGSLMLGDGEMVTTNYATPIIAADGAGGALTVWDETVGSVTRVHAQRIYYGFTKTEALNSKTDTSVTAKGPSGDIKIDIPANTLDKDINITVNPSPAFPVVPSSQTGFKACGVGVEITPSDTSVKYLKPMTIKMSYLDGNVSGMDESKLVIAVYNPATGVWEVLPSKPDAAGNSVTATTVHLSLFQVMQFTPSSTLDNLKAYPVPFKPSSNVRMTFSGMPADASVKIFNVAGEKIFDTSANTSGVATWEGKNTAGRSVASGVYLALVDSSAGKKTIKIAVEK